MKRVANQASIVHTFVRKKFKTDSQKPVQDHSLIGTTPGGFSEEDWLAAEADWLEATEERTWKSRFMVAIIHVAGA